MVTAPIINFTFVHNLVTSCQNYNMQIKAQLPRVGIALGTTPGHTFTSWGLAGQGQRLHARPPQTAATNRPNLLVDAAPMSGVGVNDLATIEGNVLLAQTADDATDDCGFQLTGNLLVTNNIIMNVKGDGCAGIKVMQHQAIYPRIVSILNNTIFIDGSSASPCLSLWDLQNGYTQVVANNAFIRGDTNAQAISHGTIPGTTIITSNIVRGTGALAGMTTITTPISQIFLGTTDVPSTANFYPAAGSPLINAGSNTYATTHDFNRFLRPKGAAADVGAYEAGISFNPGWQLAIGLKRITGDVNNDNVVDMTDLLLLAKRLGVARQAPRASTPPAISTAMASSMWSICS